MARRLTTQELLKNKRARVKGGGQVKESDNIRSDEFQSYKIIKRLGQGAFGTVYQVEKDGTYYALKSLDVKKTTHRDMAVKEWENMHKLFSAEDKTNHIVMPIKYFDDTVNKMFHIIMEYVKDGDLENYCYDKIYNEQNINTKLNSKIKLAKQLVDAIVFLHDKNLVHSDLKFENILMKDDTVKISDFGISCFLEYCNYTGGTPTFMDPMLVFSPGYKLNKECDIYSLGVILFQIFAETKYAQRSYMDEDETIENFQNKYNNNEYKDSFFPLIFNMLQPFTPANRLTINEIKDLLKEDNVTEVTEVMIHNKLSIRMTKAIEDQKERLAAMRSQQKSPADNRKRLYTLVKQALQNSLYTVLTKDVISELGHADSDNNNHVKTIKEIVKELKNNNSLGDSN